MTKSPAATAAFRRFARLNFCFWLAVAGIPLAPLLALVLAVIVFKIAGANVSAPIGLTAPLWAVVAVAMVLFLRGRRKAAKRSRDLALLAEQLGLEFVTPAPCEKLALLATIGFMENPLEQKGVNVLEGTPGGRSMFSLDYTYSYFYGAVSVVGEQTLVVFPGVFSHLPSTAMIPLSAMDQLADRVLGAGDRISAPPIHPAAAIFNQQFAVSSADPTIATSLFSPQLIDLLLGDRLLNVVVERGHLIIFRRLTFVPAKEYKGFLANAFQVAQLLTR